MVDEKFMKATLVAGLLFIAPSLAQAQLFDEAPAPLLFDTPQFFTSLLAGVVLAIGFQVVFLTLTVATGVSLVNSQASPTGDIARKPKQKRETFVERINPRVGAWIIATASVSLFFASLLAVKLSMIASNVLGLTLGLVIWASFFIVVMYLEMQAGFSLVAGVFKAALSNVRACFGSLKGGIRHENKHIAFPITKTSEMSPELTQALENGKLTKRIGRYLDKLLPREPDYLFFRVELTNLLKESIPGQSVATREAMFDRQAFVKLVEEQPHLSKQQVRSLTQLFNDVTKQVGASLKASNIVLESEQFTPDQPREHKKMEAYRLNTGKESLNPDAIRKDIEQIITGPWYPQACSNGHLRQLDQSSLVSLLSQRADMTVEDASEVSSYLEKAFDLIRQRFMVAAGVENGDSDWGQGDNKPDRYGASVSHQAPAPYYSQADQVSMSQFESKMRVLLAAVEHSKFNYDRIKLDFEALFSHPNAISGVSQTRLEQYDRELLNDLLHFRDDISQEDTVHLMTTLEEAKEAVIRKMERIEAEAQYRSTQLKELSMREAEQARTASTSAAWWVLVATLISGIAAALGGMLSVS